MNAMRPKSASFTQAAAPAKPTEDSTLFASGHMDTAAREGQHKVTLYPRVGPGDPQRPLLLATLVYDHPGDDAAGLALYFEATIDDRAYKAYARIGKSVGEFHRIQTEIRASERARSVFWRMFFSIYNQLICMH